MTHDPDRRKPGRPYCEAFPMIDVHDLVRAAKAGQVYQEWVDQDGLIVGFMSRQSDITDRVTIFYHFYGTQNVEMGAGTLELDIRVGRAGAHWRKPSLVCPKCGASVTRLYYAMGEWACKASHDLLNILQRLSPINKAIYRKEELRDKVKIEPKTSKDQRRLEKTKAKYGAAVRDLAEDHRSELPWYLQFRTRGRWLKPGAKPKKRKDLGSVGYGWIPGMRGQLPGLEHPEQIRARRPSRASTRAAETSSPAAAPAGDPTPLPLPGSKAPGARDMYELIPDLDLFKEIEINIPDL